MTPEVLFSILWTTTTIKMTKKKNGKIHYARYHPMGMRRAHPRGVNVERIIYFAFVLVVLEKLWVYVIMAPACDRNAPRWQAPPLRSETL